MDTLHNLGSEILVCRSIVPPSSRFRTDALVLVELYQPGFVFVIGVLLTVVSKDCPGKITLRDIFRKVCDYHCGKPLLVVDLLVYCIV